MLQIIAKSYIGTVIPNQFLESMKHKIRKKLTSLIGGGSSRFKEIHNNYRHTFQKNTPGIDADLQEYFDYRMAFDECNKLGLCRLADEYLIESEKVKSGMMSTAKKLRKVIYTNVIR